MDIEYTVYIWQEDGQFVAHALPLDVISAGNTPEKARAAVDEAVDLFLTTAQEMGTLDQILEEAGYYHSQVDRSSAGSGYAETSDIRRFSF
jgi:predicted RNase H-like HicB family nuclease